MSDHVPSRSPVKDASLIARCYRAADRFMDEASELASQLVMMEAAIEESTRHDKIYRLLDRVGEDLKDRGGLSWYRLKGGPAGVLLDGLLANRELQDHRLRVFGKRHSIPGYFMGQLLFSAALSRPDGTEYDQSPIEAAAFRKDAVVERLLRLYPCISSPLGPGVSTPDPRP